MMMCKNVKESCYRYWTEMFHYDHLSKNGTITTSFTFLSNRYCLFELFLFSLASS